jgi:cytochrome c553
MKKLLSIILAIALIPVAALADDDEREAQGGGKGGGKYAGEDRGKSLQPAQLNAKWLKECGSCHLAYSPGLLPAESWRKLMAGLDKHFGSDASLTAPENKEIIDFLIKNASTSWTAATAPLRISEAQWFKAKHSGKEVPAAVWKRASVKSPANCQACHPAADKADFNEKSIKIPQ